MAVRQRLQAPGQLYIPKPIVLPVAPCWQAITQTVFTFSFCLVFFAFAYFVAHLLTSASFQQQGDLPARCLILKQLHASLCSLVLFGTAALRLSKKSEQWGLARRNLWVSPVNQPRPSSQPAIFLHLFFYAHKFPSQSIRCTPQPITSPGEI